MPKRVPPLSDAQVKNAKPKPKSNPRQYRLADGGGLYLRVNPWGTKKWLFNYQKPYIKTRTNIIIGSYPDISLKQARTIKTKYKELLAQNIDPQVWEKEEAEKERRQHESTLQSVVDEWIEVERARITPDYAEDVYNSLKNHVLPKLGKMPIHLISARETIEILKPLEVQGKLEMVKRISQRLNSVMDYAINSGIIPKGSNPLTGIRKAFRKPKTLNNPTIEPGELPDLFKHMEGVEIRLVTRKLFEFQLHTLARPSEAAGATWEEFDLEQRLWILPPERMKATAKHVIPLSGQIMDLLVERKGRSGHLEYVFPSITNPRSHINNETVNKMLRRNGYGGRLTGHGLRALGSTVLNENAFDPDLIEVALSHVGNDKIRKSYNHAKYITRRREMMQWWSDHITAAKLGEVLPGKKHLIIAK